VETPRPEHGSATASWPIPSASSAPACWAAWGNPRRRRTSGLSVATGATSRVIAYAIGGLLFVLAFCPKLATVFAIMPAPVMGATLIFALSFMVIAGIQIIMSRMLDARRDLRGGHRR
jgi:hypothetical protein